MLPRNTTRRRGFTLVEILVCVVILGIAAAVVVPQIGSRNDLKAASAARMVMADLIYAQSRAIAQQSMTYVQFSTGGNNYGVLSSISPVTYLTQPITHGNYQVQFGPTATNGLTDIRLTNVNFGSGLQTIAFDEMGVPYACDTSMGTTTQLVGTGTIGITCGTYTMTISVQQDTGEISVQ